MEIGLYRKMKSMGLIQNSGYSTTPEFSRTGKSYDAAREISKVPEGVSVPDTSIMDSDGSVEVIGRRSTIENDVYILTAVRTGRKE